MERNSLMQVCFKRFSAIKSSELIFVSIATYINLPIQRVNCRYSYIFKRFYIMLFWTKLDFFNFIKRPIPLMSYIYISTITSLMTHLQHTLLMTLPLTLK